MNEPQNRTPPKRRDRAAGFIYVVDDEPMLLELATVILEPQGYRVKCFRDPELALESFGQANPGLICS